MTEIIIIVILAGLIIFAVVQTVRKFQKGGGCCGEHQPTEKSNSAKGRRKADYPHEIDIKISGMTCSNCATRVENALNSIDGVWAKVDLNRNTAHIRTKEQPDKKALCAVIAKAGYIPEH